MSLNERIIFGTMRMHENGRTPEQWSGFLEALYERGVRVLHSSSEYESFDLLRASLEALRQTAPSCRFGHVVKLAEPSFDDDGFNSTHLEARLAEYRDALHSDVIEGVQWMWRRDLKDEPKRLADLGRSLSQIGDAVNTLKQKGAIDRFFCFPYTTGCANRLIDAEWLDGYTVYRNAQEREYDYLLDACSERSKRCLIIRPFAAGVALEAGSPSPQAQLKLALDHDAIEAAILSTSSLSHLDELIG